MKHIHHTHTDKDTDTYRQRHTGIYNKHVYIYYNVCVSFEFVSSCLLGLKC